MKAWEATDPTMTAGFFVDLIREEQVGYTAVPIKKKMTVLERPAFALRQ